MEKRIDKAINNPKLKQMADAMRDYDIGNLSTAELKVAMEEGIGLAPFTAQMLIEMFEKEINKENNDD